MEYSDFDLWIDHDDDDRYRLRANAKGCGEPKETATLNLDRIHQQRNKLLQRETNKDHLVAFGTELYETLFKGQIGRGFHDCCSGDVGVRLRLRIPPEVATVPWEFLYNPTKKLFLATSVTTPVVRYMEFQGPIPNLEVSLPLRMLVVIPDYRHSALEQIDADKEEFNLIQALSDLRIVELTVLKNEEATLASVYDQLVKHEYHCFHFIGHGDLKDGRGCLLFNKNNGDIDTVDEDRFAETFDNHPSMKLIVLNSCKGAAVSSDTLVGMAPQLVERGIPAVVAMQFSIYDKAAVQFSSVFYMSLFEGSQQGAVDFAISQARHRLKAEFPGQPEFGTPVLFMRSEHGILFNPENPVRDERSKETLAQVIREYEEIIEALKKDQEQDEEKLKKAVEAIRKVKGEQERRKLRNQCIGVASSTVVLVFFLAWVSLFDIFGLDTRIESYTIWLGDLFAGKSISDEIVLVPISNETERDLGKSFDRSWRREHAMLVDKLSKAGAKVIAFDMYFKERGEYDQRFINAIERAKQRGTAVILGYRDLQEGRPKIAEGLRRAASGLGVVCIGAKIGNARTAPLAIAIEKQTLIRSLALTTIMAARGDKDFIVDWDNRYIRVFGTNAATSEKVGFSERTDSTRMHTGCPVIGKGNKVADLFIDLLPLDVLRDPSRNYAYEDVINGIDSEFETSFKNRIVLVGIESEQDSLKVHRHPHREHYGMELQAEALNSLLNGVTIRSLDEGGQFLIMVLLAFLGAFIHFWMPRPSAHAPKMLLLLVLLGYLASTVYVYSQYRLLLNTLYHAAALAAAYWVTGKIQRKWFE